MASSTESGRGPREKNPSLAAFLAIFPGMGAVYNGNFVKGLTFMLVFAVLIVLTTQHFKLLQRNLIYTGITRGRKLVGILGTAKALRIAIHNNSVHARRTGLCARLAAAFPG